MLDINYWSIIHTPLKTLVVCKLLLVSFTYVFIGFEFHFHFPMALKNEDSGHAH